MCYICKLASVSTNRDPRLYAPAGSTIYSNVWEDNGWKDSSESHAEFVQSLQLPNDLATSPLFQNWMIHSDMLHVLYRGILPQFLGSAIISMARENFWSQNGIAHNLQVAHRLCVDHLHRNGLRISLDDFRSDKFKGDNGYFELPGKGSDAKLVAQWLPTQTAKLVLLDESNQSFKVLDAQRSCKQREVVFTNACK